MIRPMEKTHQVQAWREYRGYSLQDLAEKAGITAEVLQAIENEDHDLSLSLLHQLSFTLGIPVTWLLSHPTIVQFFHDDGDEQQDLRNSPQIETSLAEYVLKGMQEQEELYILLAALIWHGNPKLIRAAEVNLRSLLRQARTVSLPWQSRPPVHFEPPSD